jgi:CubicO group peptidase (beta-lactamase class C family)
MDAALLADAVGYLERWLDYRQRTLQIPGLVGAFAADGKLLLEKAYGVCDLESGAALTVDTPFPVASHSKTFTTALVLRLVEQDRLGLDDPVGRWLPDAAEGVRSARVGELLSHTAGITRDSRDADFWQLARPFPSGDEVVAMAESVLGRHARLKYSNVGFGLLGRVIEEACQEPYAAVARRELLDVLRLDATTTDPAGRACPVGHSARRGGADRRPLALPSAAALSPAAGYCSTAADLCAFATALCDGDSPLLADDSRRAMRHVVWPGENGDADYCLGLMHTKVGDRHVHGHGGAYPGFITSTRFIAADRVVAVVLANAIDAASQELTSTMLAIADFAQGCAGSAVVPPGLTGRYSGIWGTQDVVRLGSQLFAFDPELPDPLERRTELSPDGDGGWTVTRSSGYANPGEPVTFADGTARFGGMTLRRELSW